MIKDQANQDLKKVPSLKACQSQLSVYDLIHQQQIAEDQINFFTEKGTPVSLLTHGQLKNISSNLKQQNTNKSLASELQVEWKRQKQNITNAQNNQSEQGELQFNHNGSTDKLQQSGYTLIDEQTLQQIKTNKNLNENQCFIVQVKQQDRNCYQNKYAQIKQINQFQSNLRSSHSRNTQKQKNRLNKKMKQFAQKNSFTVSKYIEPKNLEYYPEKDKNLTNFFTNKRSFISTNTNKSKENIFYKVTNQPNLINKKHNQSQFKFQNHKALNIKGSNSNGKNRHTFTNDNQRQERSDDTFLSILNKNNQIKIRPQTVKYGCSSQTKYKQNINIDVNIKKYQKLQDLQKWTLTECEINALINSNVNQNRKIAKFMQVNNKFYQKHCQSELTHFINFKQTDKRNRRIKLNKNTSCLDPQGTNYKWVNQNQQNIKFKKVQISVDRQDIIDGRQVQMEQQLAKLQTKVQKKLPYLLKMGVNFKLKQKTKGKTHN